MATDPQSLADESACYVCAGANLVQAFQLALLARIATASAVVLVPTSYRVTPSTTAPLAGAVVPVTAQLLDQFGNALHTAGRIVTWSKTGAGGSFDFPTSTTNASGIATINFTVNTLANENQRVIGTDAGGITGTSANMKIVEGPASKYLVTSDFYTPVPQQVINISAQLTDQYNNAVATAGIVVTWSKTGAGGSFATATSNTDGSGIATVAFTTGSTNGTVYVVTGTDSSARTGSTSNITLTLSAQNSDWITRVLAAGGAQPGATTLMANDTFYSALVAAGIDGKVKVVNLFAPDNLIASITPFLRAAFGGGASWANNGPFVGGDLTVNGLKGDGTKYLQTSWAPNSAGYWTDSTYHASLYVSLGEKTAGQAELGSVVLGGIGFRTYYQAVDNNTYISDIVTDTVPNDYIFTISAGTLAGYMCMSRTTSTRFDCYFANSGVAHSSVFNSVRTQSAAIPNIPMTVFAKNENGAPDSFSKKRLSACTYGTGLTSAESLALYNAIQAFRTAIGGGFV